MRLQALSWLCLSLLVGCYGPPLPPPEGDPRFKPLKVAVLEFEDGREEIQDNGTLGALAWLCLPLIPWWTTGDQPTDERVGHVPRVPDCELTPRRLRDLLVSSGSFAVVDYAPDSTGDYDLVIRGRLRHQLIEHTWYSYGLTGFATLLPCLFLGVPMNGLHQHVAYELEVLDGSGAQLARLDAECDETSYDFSYWWWIFGPYSLRTWEVFQRADRMAFEGLLELARARFDDPEAAAEERRRRQREALDPELKEFLRLLLDPGTPAEQRDTLSLHYAHKVSLLEALRRVEERLTAHEQELRDKRWREYSQNVWARQRAYNRAVRRQMAQAAVLSLGASLRQPTAPRAVSTAETIDAAAKALHIGLESVFEVQQTERALDGMADSAREQLGKQLAADGRAFAGVRGDRQRVREEWLRRYRLITPSLAQALSGEWTPPAPGTCLACGERTPAPAKFCSGCGVPLMEAR